MTKRFTSVEQAIDNAARIALDRLERGQVPSFFVEFLAFGLKQAWACLFGGLMLAMIVASAMLYPADAAINRYDALFLGALAIQAGMIVFKLELLDEVAVIMLFHVVGTAMEIFKTAVGSWIYPEEVVFRIGGVPLFAGFMYAAVGSYLARVSRIFQFQYRHYPPLWITGLLAIAIYINFFAHHYFWDVRYVLFVCLILIYGRTVVYYRIFRYRLCMPLLVGLVLVALFIWFAENISTFSRAWIYPNQSDGWRPVSAAKLGSWLLLMVISFVMVTFIRRPERVSDEVPSDGALDKDAPNEKGPQTRGP